MSDAMWSEADERMLVLPSVRAVRCWGGVGRGSGHRYGRDVPCDPMPRTKVRRKRPHPASEDRFTVRRPEPEPPDPTDEMPHVLYDGKRYALDVAPDHRDVAELEFRRSVRMSQVRCRFGSVADGDAWALWLCVGDASTGECSERSAVGFYRSRDAARRAAGARRVESGVEEWWELPDGRFLEVSRLGAGAPGEVVG